MASEIVPSILAGILESNGGIRVVVTPEDQLRHHVNEGERVFIIPGVVFDKVPTDYKFVNETLEYVKAHAG